MVYKILLFAHRKADISPSEFKKHLEDVHMPLLKEIFGPVFPLSHTRRYIHRAGTEGFYDATVLVGNQDDFDFDVVSELVFEDEGAFKEYFAKYQNEEVALTISEDEKKFLNSAKMRAVVLGDVAETSRD